MHELINLCEYGFSLPSSFARRLAISVLSYPLRVKSFTRSTKSVVRNVLGIYFSPNIAAMRFIFRIVAFTVLALYKL